MKNDENPKKKLSISDLGKVHRDLQIMLGAHDLVGAEVLAEKHALRLGFSEEEYLRMIKVLAILGLWGLDE